MEARITYGHTYVHEDGSIADRSIKGRKLVFYCAVSKNEGIRLSRNGPETEMCIYMDEDFYSNSDSEDRKEKISRLIKVIEKSDIDKEIKRGIKKLFKKNKLKSGIHKL